MHKFHLVQKLYADNHATTKFIEKYYSDRIGYPISIRLDMRTDTSYFSKPYIVISGQNLIKFANFNTKLFRPLFYSLMLHEIGHAIYTDDLPYSNTANVLEDNRLEHQISLWNTRVQFRLMRHIYQDEIIKSVGFDRLLNDKTVISLALLRTVKNQQYIQALGFTLERKSIIKDILQLNQEYMSKDYELRLATTQQRNELVSIINKVDTLINKLVELAEQEQEQKQQQQQQQDSQTQQSSQQDDTNEQQDDTADQGASGSGAGDDDDIQEELSRLIQDAERMVQDEQHDIPVLFNQDGDTDDYTKYRIGLFDTKRHSGIKGKETMQTSRGSIKQLNMQRYMRRNVVKGEKMFDRVSETGRGGKSAKVCFYLDISGSMIDDGKIRIATDYLKSFYDTMNKHMDIRMFGFGRHTYKITRNELNLLFIRNNLEGATELKEMKPKPQEHTVVITDGIIDNELSEKMKQHAHFVVIVDPDQRIRKHMENRTSEYKHRTFVEPTNLVKGLEQATKGIRELLLK